MILTQEKNIKLIMYFLTLLSFFILIFFSITIFYIPLIFYFIYKSQNIRKNILEAVFYQLFIWIITIILIITVIWNLLIIRILMLSLSNLDLTSNNTLIISSIAPLYLILFLLLIFGPIKGILYVLQEKEFHYPIISKWINQ
ncbi:hypothetical protein [Bacillus thuringiensis]|uniref:Uncharacterized protein n=1 Tax=Bacillus thuringiensis TaxID=1428 RepID=A0A9X6V404_BACTU|nr:hypothetical protein [Bacillus thuringiensis]AMR84853.1 hypothetical protein A3L20_12755 [Bacillus thuringiensis]KIP28034.1 tic20-like family protein [Bacillus thuringiensis serovar morrisoni]MBG9639963.1 hypothetical protein [Bacillus thuringiensis]MBG9672296.1 hypothetical protein [Bacillus thuringiensis]MCT6946357.1 hypothetical protein [Bacillus thuringiensis]